MKRVAQRTRIRRVTRTMLCDECGEVMSGEMRVDTYVDLDSASPHHVFRCASHAPVDIEPHDGHVAGCAGLGLPPSEVCACKEAA